MGGITGLITPIFAFFAIKINEKLFLLHLGNELFSFNLNPTNINLSDMKLHRDYNNNDL